MITPPELLQLARLFAAAKHLSLSTLGKKACGNNKIFVRLADGAGANSRTLERLETFFRANWPDNAPWPPSIQPGPHERRRRPPQIDEAASEGNP